MITGVGDLCLSVHIKMCKLNITVRHMAVMDIVFSLDDLPFALIVIFFVILYDLTFL